MKTPTLFHRFFLCVTLLCPGILLTGCGGASEESKKRAAVSVTVTHAGTPVTEAEVRLMMLG
ncbi:MAG: hypothetical protein KDA77_22920, partial [Planctomycetaceae bacterium]|nr:hypothetical protein [Planctomycetaceae bacterium]